MAIIVKKVMDGFVNTIIVTLWSLEVANLSPEVLQTSVGTGCGPDQEFLIKSIIPRGIIKRWPKTVFRSLFMTPPGD